MRNSKKMLSENVPVVFKDKFPDGYKNDVQYWGNIPREELHSCLQDGTAKMLTMDVDIGNICGLNCPSCFRRDDRVDTVESPLTHEEILGYVREAKELGLKQIKILGRGEPFQNPRFLEFLEEVSGMSIGVAVFTKGHVLGSDELAERYNGHRDIHTALELVQRVKELNVSILLGFNSFDRRIQEEYVGVNEYSETVLLKGYVEFRDKAFVNLVKAGFNDYVEGEATRLALSFAPFKPENMDEVFDLYVWARVRNIYMLSCPTNLSGKGADEWEREIRTYPNYVSSMEDIYVRIYQWAVKTNLIPLASFKRDGVSLYPGCHVCNQTSAGFYLNLSGQVIQCPGRVAIFSEDIRKDGLRKVWQGCANYKRAKYGKKYNYRCVARDGHSLPTNFYSNIEARVLAELGAK